MRFVALVTVVALAASSTRAQVQEKASGGISLDSYTCTEYLADARHPDDAQKLLRGMMMVAWAAGFAAAYNQATVRADDGGLKIIGRTLGDLCLRNPTDRTIPVFLTEINRLTNNK